MDETVTISQKQYDKFLEDSQFLSYLKARGVDNWDGYSDAYEMMYEEEEE
jgi:hypothetical protein